VAIAPWDGKSNVDALVTHRHPDHYDADTLKRSLGPAGRVFCPVEIAPELEAAGLNARGVALWETVRPHASEGVAITAVPAVDWRGDHEVARDVGDGEQRTFDGGDTLCLGGRPSVSKRVRS